MTKSHTKVLYSEGNMGCHISVSMQIMKDSDSIYYHNTIRSQSGKNDNKYHVPYRVRGRTSISMDNGWCSVLYWKKRYQIAKFVNIYGREV